MKRISCALLILLLPAAASLATCASNQAQPSAILTTMLRLVLDEPIPTLHAELAENEPEPFAGLWIEK
jgi:hypothetical protein